MWVETQPSVQPFFQKLNVDNSCQETHKIRYYIFEVLSNFTVFLKFVPNILARAVVMKSYHKRLLYINETQDTLS